MSIGFHTAPPPTPPREITLWVVRKDTRHARALVRQHPLGRELVVMVGEDIGWSRLYRDQEDSRALGQMAEGCRLDSSGAGGVPTPARKS